MRKFLVTIQYNGKNYNGWQKNSNSKTVQGEIENALYKLFSTNIEVEGVSRTDSGVSAKEYYFCFSADTKLPTSRIPFKLNRFLQKDIQAYNAIEVDLDFALRKRVKSKTYVYKVYSCDHLLPLLNRDAYHVKEKLDVAKMNEQAKLLIGKHDFSSFASKGGDDKNPIKTLYSAHVSQNEDGIISISLTGDGFLYNMVRIIAGTLIDVGRGKIESIADVLMKKDRQNAGLTLPSKALTLQKVDITL